MLTGNINTALARTLSSALDKVIARESMVTPPAGAPQFVFEPVATPKPKRLVPDRDFVMPFGPSDFIGGVGTYPSQGDRLRPQLFVKGPGDINEVSMNDVMQGDLGDCYFLGPLAALAKQDPEAIKNMVVDHGDGTYTVTFKERVPDKNPPEFRDRPITVTADFPGGNNGTKHASTADQTGRGYAEIWPLVFEKAYGVLKTQQDPYWGLANERSHTHAIESLTGRPAAEAYKGSFLVNPDNLGPKNLDGVIATYLTGGTVVVGVKPGAEAGFGLKQDHIYAVERMYVDDKNQWWVQLYNPWGHSQPSPISFDELAQNNLLYVSWA